MTIKIKDKENNLLATLACDSRGVTFEGETNEEFKKWFEEKIATGITQIKELYNEERKTFTILEGPTKKDDANYCLALRDFIARSGYKVTESHPEVEEKIIEILKEIPDDNENKKIILEKLPDLSYLEQTAILEELRTD